MPDAGDAEGWRAPRAGGEGLEQGWPLVALEDVEVDDVDAVLVLEGLEDGLVGREVGEFDIRAGLVDYLVDLEGLEGGGRVGPGEAGRGEAGGEGVGEAGGDSLHGVSERGDGLVEVVEVAPGGHVVVLGHRLGAGKKEVHQLQPTVLFLING